jgi:hypothetical protein
MEQRRPERRHFTQTTSLEESLAKEATQLRKQAHGTPRALISISISGLRPRQIIGEKLAGRFAPMD